MQDSHRNGGSSTTNDESYLAAAALADFAAQSSNTVATRSRTSPSSLERNAVAGFATHLAREKQTGVFYNDQTQKFNVYGTSALTGNTFFLGSYDTEQDAQQAYNVSGGGDASTCTTTAATTKLPKATSKRSLLRSVQQDMIIAADDNEQEVQDYLVYQNDQDQSSISSNSKTSRRYRREKQSGRKMFATTTNTTTTRQTNGTATAATNTQRNGVSPTVTGRGRRTTPQRQVTTVTPKYNDDYYHHQEEEDDEDAEDDEENIYVAHDATTALTPSSATARRFHRKRTPMTKPARPRKAFTVFLEKKKRENPNVPEEDIRHLAKRQWRTKSVEQERKRYEAQYEYEKEVYEQYMASRKHESHARSLSPPLVENGVRRPTTTSPPIPTTTSSTPMVTSPAACSASKVWVTYNGGQRPKKFMEAIIYPGYGIYSGADGYVPTPPGGSFSTAGRAAAASNGVGQPWGVDGTEIWYKNDYPREVRWTLEDSQNHPIHKYHTTGRVLFFTSPSYHWRAYIRYGGREKVAKWHKTIEEAEYVVKFLIDRLQMDGMTGAGRKQLSYESFHSITNEAVEAASKACELRGRPTNGIDLNMGTQMFTATFEYNGKEEYIGEFATPDMAMLARSVAIGMSRPRRRSAKKSLADARETAISAVRMKYPHQPGAIVVAGSNMSATAAAVASTSRSSSLEAAEAPVAAPAATSSSTRRGRSRSSSRRIEEEEKEEKEEHDDIPERKDDSPERKRSRRAPSPVVSATVDPMDVTTEDSSSNDQNLEKENNENGDKIQNGVEPNTGTDVNETEQTESEEAAVPDSEEVPSAEVDVPVARPGLERYLEGYDINDEKEQRSPFYLEEQAWRLHDGEDKVLTTEDEVSSRDANKGEEVMLKPLPPVSDLPKLPSTPHCRWSFDEESRVLLANFRPTEEGKGGVTICREDEEFLLKMMERNDVTVISEGLADGLDPEIWNMEYIANRLKNTFFHRFRKFERREIQSTSEKQTNETDKMVKVSYETHEEMDVCLSMKVSDYVKYLEMRRVALEARSKVKKGSKEGTVPPASDMQDKDEEPQQNFNFIDDGGKQQSINVVDVSLYMIDLDMVKLLPELINDFSSCFKLPGCMPGGTHCMMNAVNESGRPFMGPNMYITPPASFTQMHQDGHGTVDSGHQCLSGYNEVVMLRRLPEAHKKQALRLLSGKMKNSYYDALYGLPHGDGLGEKPAWPTCEAIAKCKEMRYYPSVFILKPGQLCHINKGRLHAFRKLGPETLPSFDCHAKLRSSFIEKEGLGDTEHLCISVAWDWMYKGVTSEGINRESVATLECTVLNRINGTQSLAIPELSLLQIAQKLVTNSKPESTFLSVKNARQSSSFVPSKEATLRGILPSLRYLVDQHVAATRAARHQAREGSGEAPKKNIHIPRHQLSIQTKPNSWENPDVFELDPYGNGDFFCKLCAKELSNVYLHCDGCEKILNKDFNICLSCHKERRYCNMIQMHPLNAKRHCTINHTGNMNYNRQARCPCKNGPVCKNCGYCQGCSCRCHTWFTLNHRFLTLEEEEELLETVEKVVGEHPAVETMRRLVHLADMEVIQDQNNAEAERKEEDNKEEEKVEDAEEKKIRDLPPRKKRTRSSSNPESGTGKIYI